MPSIFGFACAYVPFMFQTTMAQRQSFETGFALVGAAGEETVVLRRLAAVRGFAAYILRARAGSLRVVGAEMRLAGLFPGGDPHPKRGERTPRWWSRGT